MDNSKAQQGVNLADQVAIVTGGGRGIGRAIAIALAKAGTATAVVARSGDQLAETVALVEVAGGRAIALPADVTDHQAVEQTVRTVEQQLGPVDLLVANAGIAGPGGPTWEVDIDEWWRCLDVNLRGPFLCARAVLPGMVRRQQGRIVITASGAGLRAWPYASAYAVSKCAVIRLVENLAAEAKEHGISVFALSPGFVRTAMTEAAAESPEDEQWFGGTFRKGLSEERDTPPENAAGLVSFLASGGADALSGCFVSVHHDIAALVQRAKEIGERDLYRLRLQT